MKKKDKHYEAFTSKSSRERFVHEVEDDEFSIGQTYEEEPAKKIRCNTCKSDKFIVGKGNAFTAIKCPNCLWELCVHDG